MQKDSEEVPERTARRDWSEKHISFVQNSVVFLAKWSLAIARHEFPGIYYLGLRDVVSRIAKLLPMRYVNISEPIVNDTSNKPDKCQTFADLLWQDKLGMQF